MPALVENVAGAHIHRESSHIYYGRAASEKEIDFVSLSEGKYSFVEVKYQGRVKEEEFRWTGEILGKSGLTILSRADYLEKPVSIIPAELFLAFYKPGGVGGPVAY